MPPRPTLLAADDAIAELLRAYTVAEVELRRELDRLIRRTILDPTSSARYRRGQVSNLLVRIAEHRAALDRQALVFASEHMSQIYGEGMLRAQRLLQAGGLDALGSPSFSLIHRQAVELLAADTFDDLARASAFLDDSARRTIREASKLRTTAGAIRGSSVGRDTTALARELARSGVSGFTDAVGRQWRLSTYAEMVVRTKSAQAYNVGTALRTEETGTTALEILDGERSRHEECLAYSGDTCSPLWSIQNPIQHPNCVRSFSPLPLHRGPVQHGTRGSAADEIARARAARELPEDLVIVPPDLTA